MDDRAAPARFMERTSADAGLASLVKASGYARTWPPDTWNLDALTLAGLYFNPALDTARAQVMATRAHVATATQRAPLGVQLAAEHHSRQVGADSPWSLGLALELPVAGRTRREARVERAAVLADAAELDVALVAWQVRGAVRDALIDLVVSRQRERALQERLAAQREMEQLVMRRVEVGMLSSRDLGQEQVATANVEAALTAERTRYQEATGSLARALGLPLATVQAMKIADDALIEAPKVPDADAARTLALHNRLDLHRRLLEFGVADAEVKLAVAAQYPEVRLSPGYLWDQGDNVWSLVTGLAFPSGAHAQVRESEALREVAAQRFSALQAEVISDVERAHEVYLAARSRVQRASHEAALAQSQLNRIQKVFDAGDGDRLQLVAARLSSLSARQSLLDAEIDQRQSAARLEDAMQRPVLGEFLTLPHVQQTAGAGK